MMKVPTHRRLCLSLALALQGGSVLASTISFGPAGDDFSIDFVPIGAAGNSPDSNDLGSVPYRFQMSRFEVSRSVIDTFNAVSGLPAITMWDMTTSGGNGPDRPATGVRWIEAAIFVNWLNTSQGHSPAYNIVSVGGIDTFQPWSDEVAWQLGGVNIFRNRDAFYFLPTESEWYKAAFYDPDIDVYYRFAIGSDTIPTSITGGTEPNGAVYGQSFSTGPADVHNAGGLSPFGTMAQNGNVYEMTETDRFYALDPDGEYRIARGGYWETASFMLPGSSTFPSVDLEAPWLGFRIAAIPEPASLSLSCLGVLLLLHRRR